MDGGEGRGGTRGEETKIICGMRKLRRETRASTPYSIELSYQSKERIVRIVVLTIQSSRRSESLGFTPEKYFLGLGCDANRPENIYHRAPRVLLMDLIRLPVEFYSHFVLSGEMCESTRREKDKRYAMFVKRRVLPC